MTHIIKLAYIISPFRCIQCEEGCEPSQDVCEVNVDEVRRFAEYYAEYEEAVPVVPHLLFPQYMDDSKPVDREKAIQAGLKLAELCDILVVFNYSENSVGMKREIEWWRKNKPNGEVEIYRLDYEWLGSSLDGLQK